MLSTAQVENIGLLDADLLDNGTRHPNLALMKISGFYKYLGNNVTLIENHSSCFTENFDQIFISKVFTFTNIPANILSLPNVQIGGTGFFEDGGENLPDEIEHHFPDYHLYDNYIEKALQNKVSRTKFADYIDYSIGFSTRGCFRKCSFCVNKKYDKPFFHSEIKEFLDISRPYIYLWDDNFLAYSGWEKILDELEDIGKPFQFRQGLDIRLMNEKKAERISKTIYHGDFIFAFDHLEDRELIEKKLKLWRRYTHRTTKLYVLCAFDSQDEKDISNTFERIAILMKYGCLPYIMRFESYKNSRFKDLYIQIARWCNQPNFFKKKSFRQFCEANQAYVKTENVLCTAFQSMIEFEKEFPEIAKKYFDLRYDELNEYRTQYGYARKYAHKPDCATCIDQQKTWENAYLEVIKRPELIYLYFTREIDLQCFSYKKIQCNGINKKTIIEWLNKTIVSLGFDEILTMLINLKYKPCIEVSEIPQFSDLNQVIYDLPSLLKDQILSFDAIGELLDNGKKKSALAQKKYGENHSKLAAQLDLAVISTENHQSSVLLSEFCEGYLDLSNKEKKAISARLMFRIPIIQQIFIDAASRVTDIDPYLKCLSETTKIRRKSNVASIIRFIHSELSFKDQLSLDAFANIRGW